MSRGLAGSSSNALKRTRRLRAMEAARRRYLMGASSGNASPVRAAMVFPAHDLTHFAVETVLGIREWLLRIAR